MNQLKINSREGESNGNKLKWLLLMIVLIGAGAALYFWQSHKIKNLNLRISELETELIDAKKPQSAKYNYTSTKGVAVKLYSPAPNTNLTEVVVVMGEVPGNWSFEASFPIKLMDSKGKIVAQTLAQVNGDWMTDKLVPFWAKLEIEDTAEGELELVLEKDNPSGLSENNDRVFIALDK